ncbi:unnamed protein product [Cylicocyclus nassatus]|uniref:Uncharacterized protein n=1 Tax=Cylicocyclus nassatus TaxID=53992 RepID=A0AA36H528_CYLNA|nr:unnamed protein product [Cylicocyclus nassatus]
MDPETCQETGTKVVTFIWYRLLQGVWIIVAILAMVGISSVYFLHIKSSKLHVNIQILLMLFLFSAFLINVVVVITQTYQLTISFTYVEPCDVFLSPSFYIIFNIAHGFFTELYLLTMATMMFERTLATVYVSSYEQMAHSAGLMGATTAILFATLIEFLLYYGATINDLQISTTNSASGIANRIDYVLIFNISSSALTMMTMIILLLVNTKRSELAIGIISHRFQTEENIETTKFIARIAFAQLIAFSVQSLGGLLLRTYGEYIYNENDVRIRKLSKLLLQVMPLFTLIISIIIAMTIRSTATRRRSRLKTQMCISNDIDYTTKYLQNQWSRAGPKTNANLPDIT